MKATEQGTVEPTRQRYQVIPRTLIFVISSNPETGSQEVLLIQGASTKRLWANKFNGLGGHVEAHESVYEAAAREVQEEAGLALTEFDLRGVINIDVGPERPGVILFVFCASTATRSVRASAEGTLQWVPTDELAAYPLVDDLVHLLPRVLADGPPLFGHYSPLPDGTLRYRLG